MAPSSERRRLAALGLSSKAVSRRRAAAPAPALARLCLPAVPPPLPPPPPGAPPLAPAPAPALSPAAALSLPACSDRQSLTRRSMSATRSACAGRTSAAAMRSRSSAAKTSPLPPSRALSTTPMMYSSAASPSPHSPAPCWSAARAICPGEKVSVASESMSVSEARMAALLSASSCSAPGADAPAERASATFRSRSRRNPSSARCGECTRR
mmetsp:Transcript_28851/g.94294  ORF Transcript_28851/g.94294 Transcript_28851/m.94294 type:complete len:211 (+) Transcript_28851:334-966(+)